MRKYLLPQTGKFYKANLHSHSTVSDGILSPEEMKKLYVEHGYSVIAYTDHNVLIDHSDLNDENFLALNGMELQTSEEKEKKPYFKTCHICFIALDPDNLTQFCYHREKYISGNAQNYRHLVKFDENEPDFERVYTPECVTEMMTKGREAGFFVTYNHPCWSMENYNDYSRYHGMHAMEICNWGSTKNGFTDYCPQVYDDLLRCGKKIFCLGTDDNHNHHPINSYKNGSFGAFTMIKAEKLDYKCITNALVAGDIYASQGPEIYDLWYEDGKIHINCSTAKKIFISTGRRRCDVFGAFDDGDVNEAEFEVFPEDVYVRLTVLDERGRHANTRAYFVEDLI